MADISFLLLLFFLVTTTFDVDTGIGLVLPPPVDESQEVKIRKENIMKVLVNAAGEVLIDDEITTISQIHILVKDKIKTNDKLIISVKVDRETPYRIYIQALDEIKQSYAELRDEYSVATFGIPMKHLSRKQLEQVREFVPQRISIAEPERTR